jgi:hypothetical protein
LAADLKAIYRIALSVLYPIARFRSNTLMPIARARALAEAKSIVLPIFAMLMSIFWPAISTL